MTPALPTFRHIQQAARVLGDVVVRTPVLRSAMLDERIGGQVFLKCENLQHTGTFKFRGAYFALVQKENIVPFHTVVTLSSGNHAQGLALASGLLGFKAHIVMPEPVNSFKREGAERLGAQVSVAPTRQEGQEFLGDLVQKHRGMLVHPYNDPDVIAGQGTATQELLKEVTDLEVILAPVGGGGLLSGTCLAAHGHSPAIKVIGAEPARALDALPSLRQGEILTPDPADTIAEGLRTSLGDLTFAIVQDHVEDIVVVEEEEIGPAMRIAFESIKIVLEPSAAVALVPILRGEPILRGKRVGVILSGGNIRLPHFLSIMSGPGIEFERETRD